jgi:aspartyl-tRNA(Asn)/glutamyl-tRNA(Gln) amidotransferase subunit B
MSESDPKPNYLPTIGIECHVQLKTKSKLFAGVGNDARDASPNTLVSHICFGLPGALPVLNKEALHLACRAAYALSAKPELFSKFDRKHYFYPDLPKGYQITQYDQPIIKAGKIVIDDDGQIKQINITRAHLEEDAGKNTHPTGKDYSLVDLNRAGTPLLEIVSEPDMHSSSEAKAYVRELYLLMRYADVSDADLYYGNMRFDVNVSVSAQAGKLGTRSETKNLNSFRSVEKAVDYEIKRQVELLNKGGKIVQETRGWDDTKQKTFSQRSKEEANDYRYFPDPDLPPVVFEESYLKEVEAEMPILPAEWRRRLSDLGLSKAQIETLLDANVEFLGEKYLELIHGFLSEKDFARQMANWIVNIDIPFVREHPERTSDTRRDKIYPAVAELTKENMLSSTKAKELVVALLGIEELPKNIELYAQQNGFIQVSDQTEVTELVDSVIAQNSQAADDVKNGQSKAVGFLVGQIMKASAGKVNPQLAEKLIKDRLSNSR